MTIKKNINSTKNLCYRLPAICGKNNKSMIEYK